MAGPIPTNQLRLESVGLADRADAFTLICAACGHRTDTVPCAQCGGDPRLQGRYRLETIESDDGPGVVYGAGDKLNIT
jgi:hypothetical protein